jgi:hypothetical protein
VLRIGIGPGKIEHEFAARMPFAVQRHGPDEASAGVLDQQMPGRPTRARHGAAGLLEREQKFVAQERLARA